MGLTLKHPETGELVEAASKKEYNNLRFGGGYVPADDDKKQAPKKTGEPAKPVDAAPKTENPPAR